MKKTISVILAAVIAASAVSCAAAPTDALLTPHSSLLTSTSSTAYADKAWLSSRLGEVPDSVTVGTADQLGIDMTGFENDGYIIRTNDGETVVCGKTADGLDRAVRKYAKAYEAGEVPDTTYHEGYRIKDLRIAGNPISDYTIVVPEDHHANIDFAARELARLIEKGTGVALPTAVGTADGHRIVFTTTDDPELRGDGYRYEVKDGDLVFTGAYDRGCSNAVWRFLEKELGWLSLTYGTSYLTEADLIDFPEGLSGGETPAFDFVEYYTVYNYNKDNERSAMTAAEKTSTVLTNCCHGMQGSGFAGDAYDLTVEQMCNTSDEQYEIFYENATAYIERRLAAGDVIGKTFLAIDIAQGDNDGWCDCVSCRKLYQKEGSQAGPVVYLANRFCDDIRDLYPGLLVQIFAYSYTKKPPKNLIPDENVRVTFCYDMCCMNHHLDGTECGTNYLWNGLNNKVLAEYFDKWAAISKDIYVWYYIFTLSVQYTMVDNIYGDIRYLRDHGARGIFFEIEANGVGIAGVEYSLLNEMNWNTGMTEAEYEDFLCSMLKKEYGDGWDNIRQYIDIWERSQNLVPCWQGWGFLNMYSWDDRYDIAFVERNFDSMRTLVEDAIPLCASAYEERNTELFSCAALFYGIYSCYFRAEARGDSARLAELSDYYDLMIERYIKNGYDPLGAGIYLVLVDKPVYPATVGEWAENVRGYICERHLAGYSGMNHG